MLDKLTASVLGAVNAVSGGAYKVIELGEIVSSLPAELKADPVGVENSIRYLAERGYVDVRYFERGTCCLCSLPKGRSYEESASELAEARKEKRGKSGWLPAFFGALIGAFTGGALSALLLLLLH